MIELLLGQEPAPATFAVGGRYVLGFAVDGETPTQAAWSLGRRREYKHTGTGQVIFAPEAAEPYYLYVRADAQEAIFILSVTVTGASADKVTIAWSEPAPRSRSAFGASISASTKPQSIGWSLLYNNVPVQSGTGHAVTVSPVSAGIYRLVATVLDSHGNTVIAESSVAIPFPYGLQSVVTPQQPTDATLYHIGDVYSPLIEGQETECSYLPYELMNLATVVKLVPGTTHFKAELDPVFSDVDDEVIVRTAHGNWTLKGPPAGLSTEAMPYDYRHGQPVQPAALDLNVRYAVEALNVHGPVANAFKFRVVFRCYRSGAALFRYSPCDWSAYYGGQGERQRRLIALITNVEAVLDAEWPDNRLGSRDQEPYAATNQKRIIGQFNVTGNPDRPLYAEDHFYTAQNAIAHYESPEGRLRDLIVSCVYGLAGVRPCYLDFSQPALPRIVQRIKQLSGKLVLYVAGGALTKGTYVHVRIYTGKSPGWITVSVPIFESVYNPNFYEYAKAGEAAISVPDFEFDRVGVLMDLYVNEAIAQSGAASYEPMHQIAEDAFFASINSPAIKVDTACFHDPVAVPIFEGTFAGSAVALPDCNRLSCGPVGIYCYTTTTGTIPPDPNTPPVADPQNLTTPQDTPLDITLTATDAETPSQLTYIVTIAPLFGAISGNPSPPNIRYTPDAGFYGLDDFGFTVTDPGGLTDSAAITISVTQAIPPNTPPHAVDRSLTTPQDTPLAVTLTGIDAETPLSLTFLVTIGAVHGAVTGLAPNVTYTPDPGYTGPDQFTFSVTDPGALSDTGVVSITVTPVAPPNTPPTAIDRNLTTLQDTALPITLTGIDAETPLSLNFAIVTGPVHGTLSGSAPNVVYHPNAGYSGPDSFTFSVTDPGALSDNGLVSITVTPVAPPNLPPTANPQTLGMNQDTTLAITLTGSDPEGGALTFAIVTGPFHGTMGGSGANRTYTPSPGYSGPDQFTFSVTDVGSLSDTAIISIAVNSAPTANPQSVSLDQDTTLAITLTGSDPEGGALTFAIVTGPFHGHLTGTAPNVVYHPNSSYVGSDSFTFRVTDTGGLTDTAVVSITVNHVNHTPTANPQSVSLDQDTSIAITLTGSDPDGDTLIAFTITVGPAHGVMGGSGANVTYTPNPGYAGPDSFQFTVKDNGTPNLTSTAATVSITVNSTSGIFYLMIGVYTSDAVCTSKVVDKPLPALYNISSLDGNPVLFELVSKAAIPPPVDVLPLTNELTGPMIFMVKIDQRLIDIDTVAPGLETLQTIAFSMHFERHTIPGEAEPIETNCIVFGDPYDFSTPIINIINRLKSQQASETYAGTWADPFRFMKNPS